MDASQETIQIANKNMKRCPSSLVIREMQIKNHKVDLLEPSNCEWEGKVDEPLWKTV